MYYRIGTVVEVTGGRARVRFDGRPGCSSCAGGQGCGLGPLVSLLRGSGADTTLIELPADGIVPGQSVRLAMAGSRIVSAATLAYLVPLATMVAGAAIGAALPGAAGDLPAVAGAGAGLAAGWLLLALGRRVLVFNPGDIERAPAAGS